MALFILNPGITPLGDFDLLDSDAAALKGGEVMTLDKALRAGTDRAAKDVLDGYLAPGVSEGTPTAYRTVARIADEATETYKLFFLADDGKAYYGVMFGSVIGAPVGQSTTGTNFGPSTVTGSGKVTLWDKPGLYAVSLDAVAADVIPATLDTPLPGEVLYRSTGGLLTRASGTGDKIAAFIELTDKGSLVTTPGRLVGAAEVFDRIKIQFYGADKNA